MTQYKSKGSSTCKHKTQKSFDFSSTVKQKVSKNLNSTVEDLKKRKKVKSRVSKLSNYISKPNPSSRPQNQNLSPSKKSKPKITPALGSPKNKLHRKNLEESRNKDMYSPLGQITRRLVLNEKRIDGSNSKLQKSGSKHKKTGSRIKHMHIDLFKTQGAISSQQSRLL